MSKDPFEFEYFDAEEKALIEAIEAGEYDGGKSDMSAENIAKLQEAARRKLAEIAVEKEAAKAASKKISLRINERDLALVKARAAKEGIPYQTLIKSIIHQAVN